MSNTYNIINTIVISYEWDRFHREVVETVRPVSVIRNIRSVAPLLRSGITFRVLPDRITRCTAQYCTSEMSTWVLLF